MVKDVDGSIDISIKPTGERDRWYVNVSGIGSEQPGTRTIAILDDVALIVLAESVLDGITDRIDVESHSRGMQMLEMLRLEVAGS